MSGWPSNGHFLATREALHFPPVSEWVTRFRTCFTCLICAHCHTFFSDDQMFGWDWKSQFLQKVWPWKDFQIVRLSWTCLICVYCHTFFSDDQMFGWDWKSPFLFCGHGRSWSIEGLLTSNGPDFRGGITKLQTAPKKTLPLLQTTTSSTRTTLSELTRLFKHFLCSKREEVIVTSEMIISRRWPLLSWWCKLLFLSNKGKLDTSWHYIVKNEKYLFQVQCIWHCSDKQDSNWKFFKSFQQ